MARRPSRFLSRRFSESADGQRYLRAATPVPVVNKKCILCHPGRKVGDLLGAISYKLTVR